MLITVPQSSIQSTGINTVNVGQIGIGPITIGQLVLTDLELNTAADGAFLKNLVVTVTYTMSLDWHLHIDLPGKSIDQSGTEDLDSPQFIVGLGDVQIPGLQNIKIAIDSLSLDQVAATSNPVTNVQLGSAVAQQIEAKNLVVPAHGFTLVGLSIGGLNVGGFGTPAASLDSLSIGRVHGEATPFGHMALSNLALPSAAIADIVGQGVDTVGTPKPKAFHLDLGCLDLTLKVNPQAEAHIDQVVIQNIKASTAIGKLELNNIVAPYELLNLTLSQVGIDTITVPTIAVA
jgi:hypothetical protein